MHSTVNLDLSRFYPAPDETLFEYWASWSPFAPMIGIEWRMAKALNLPDMPSSTDLAATPRDLAELLPSGGGDADAVSKVIEAACAEDAEVITSPPKPAPAKKKAKTPPKVVSTAAETEPSVAAKKKKPISTKPAKAASAAKPDDLTLIKGVGPKLAKILAAEGITQFSQIAQWTPKDIAKWDARPEVISGRTSRDDWVGQAKKLAKA